MKSPRCYKCGGRKRQGGYGFAAGPLGGYEFCGARKCGVLLSFYPDVEGLDAEQTESVQAYAEQVRMANDLKLRRAGANVVTSVEKGTA
jgi:hypothetical protein